VPPELLENLRLALEKAAVPTPESRSP